MATAEQTEKVYEVTLSTTAVLHVTADSQEKAVELAEETAIEDPDVLDVLMQNLEADFVREHG